MSVTIKASLYVDSWRGNPVEIRRFSVDEVAVKSYEFLVEQVAKVFPSATAENITLAWIDGDKDTIIISSDDELAQALEYHRGNLFRLYIKKDSVQDQKGDPGSIHAGNPEQKGCLHPGVICDGCNEPIYGSRFKCLICSDYDLCTGCEGKGTHINHNMVEIERPAGFSPWASAFPGHPFGWYGAGFGGNSCGRGQWGRRPRGCPYRGGWGGRGRHGECPSFPGQGRECKPDSKPDDDRAAESEPMDTEQKGSPSEEDRRQYLRRVGDAVSSFLEPLGIKVDVDVANGGSESGKPAESSADPPSGATATSEDAVEIALAQLKSMGYEDEGGWLTELIRAKGGDVTKVLDALHPTSDEL